MSKLNQYLSVIFIISIIVAMLVIGYYSKEINRINKENHEKEIIEEEKTYVSISVMLPEDMTNEQIQEIEDAIKRIEGVNTIKFESKDDALNNDRARLENNQKSLAELESDNSYRASYIVTLTDNKLLNQVKDKLNAIDDDLEIIVKEIKLPADYYK